LKVGILSSFYPEIQGGAETSLAVLLDGLQRLSLDQGLFAPSKAQSNIHIRVVRIKHFGAIPKRMKLFGMRGLH